MKFDLYRPSAWRTFVLLIAGVCLSSPAWANTALWIANPGVSANTNWSDNLNWNNSLGGTLGFTNNDVAFGGAGSVGSAGLINNVVDTSGLTLSLAYTNAPTQFHTTLIPDGIILTNANNLVVGNKTADAYTTVVNIVGGGTLIQNGATVDVRNNGSAVSTALATLDMSGLSNFVSTASGGTIGVGAGTVNRSGGVLTLAGGSNFLNAATINFATGNGANAGPGAARFNLGFGTNIINVGTVNIVSAKNTGTFQFFGSTGGLRLRGVGGTDADRANMTIANRAPQSGTGNTTGNFSLNGHPVDIKAGTITLATDTMAGGNAATGTISFDTGIIDATAINMAIVGNAAVLGATATINIGANATLLVGAGGISLVNQTAGNGGLGNLNITGGTLQSSGNIRKSTAAGTANITLTGGKLILGGTTNTIGSPAAPIDNLTLADSTLTIPALSAEATVVATILNISGSTDTINVSSVPGTATFPTQYPLITYSGLGGAYDFVLGTMPGTYQGYLSNNAGALSIDLVITNSLVKSDTWNGNVSSAWDSSTLNWLSAGSPTNYQQGDLVTFDDSLTGRTNVNLAETLLPGTLVVNNSLSNYVFGGSGKISGVTSLVKQGSGSLTLTETGGDNFSGGVSVENGILVLDNPGSAISGGLTISSGAVQIGNNDANGALPSGPISNNGALIFKRTDNVNVTTPISGTGSLTQNGAGTLALTGANDYTGNTTVGSGTLALSGVGTIASSAAVLIGSGTLDVSATVAPVPLTSLTASNSTTVVALNASGVPRISVNSLTFAGNTNLINVVSLPPIASYPVTFAIVQSASGAAGGFNFGVGSLPVASPAYTANATLSPDQTTVRLTVTSGPVGVRPSVVWNGADLPNLNTNWSDAQNWFLPGVPGLVDNVVFNNTAAVAASALATPGGGPSALIPENVNNVVDANFTVSTLSYSNVGGTYHNTYINNGRTLSVTNLGSLNVGLLDSPSAQEFVTISGPGGALQVSNTNANMQVWVGTATGGGSQATLDLSALNNFNANVSRLIVGATIGNIVNRPSGVIYLARTNVITATYQTTNIETGTITANSAITVGDCNQNAGPASTIWLGLANTISADTISIGRQKAPSHLQFNAIYANVAPYPSVTFRGYSSAQVSVFDVGDGLGNTGTTAFSADANMGGGFVNANVDTMNIGRASSGGTGAATSVGTLSFDAGVISVNTLNIGLQPAVNLKAGIGTNNIGSNTVIGASATLVVRGNLNLGATPPDTLSSVTAGTLNITNGTVLANNITAGTNAAYSIVGVYGGRLVVTNNLGIPGAGLGTLELAPLGTPDNSATVLQLKADVTPTATVTNLNLDGMTTTTNIINISSAPAITDVELPLIQYVALNVINGTFNLGLGSLPPGYTGYLTNDTVTSTIALVLTGAPRPRPVITASVFQPGIGLVSSGTNGTPNAPYYVLSTTNVALPLTSWLAIATNNFEADGSFSFTNVVNAANPRRFFVLQVP